MKKLSLIFLLASLALANDVSFKNMKSCESVQLSKFTLLVSCHQMDYLVEYRKVDDEEKDTIKKITAITPKNQVVIKTIGR